MMLPRHFPLSRVAALAILLAVIATLWLGLVSPLWSAWAERTDQADHAAEMLVRLRQDIADAPRLQAEAASLGDGAQDRSTVLAAANVNLAGATLQAEVKRIAEANGVQLRSIQQLPAVPQDGLSRVGVRADLQSDTRQLARILYDLEAHNPVLLVRALSVQGQERPSADAANQPVTLGVQIEVTAVTGPAE